MKRKDQKFRFERVERDIPLWDARMLDVVILDMNFGLPNLGHDSLVHAVHESAEIALEGTSLEVRVLSFDIRRLHKIPPFDPDRFGLYVGTGGPGHLDPRNNDGVSEYSEGVAEKIEWEDTLFDLYDRILEDERVALLSFCHSFGLMCRWGGFADPTLRAGTKAPSSGIVRNRLTKEAIAHPWFGRFARELEESPLFRALDSRLFDLIPNGRPMPAGSSYLAFEATPEGDEGEALTMFELARDVSGTMPRVFGANHHPEVVDLAHLEEVLEEKLVSGEVSPEWYEERGEALRRYWNERDVDERVRRTSMYTLLGVLEFHLRRLAHARVGESIAV